MNKEDKGNVKNLERWIETANSNQKTPIIISRDGK